MFPLLFTACCFELRQSNITDSDVQRLIKGYPIPECDFYEENPPTNYKIEVVPGKKYCFAINGSIFINGKPVKISGYVDNQFCFSGFGVAATIDTSVKVVKHAVMIETNETQNITLFGSVSIRVGRPVYVTTKNKVNEFDLRQMMDKTDSKYSMFFLLGEKKYVSLDVKMGDNTDGYVKTDTGNKIRIWSNDKKNLNYEKQALIYAEVYSNHKYSSAYVKMKCGGSDFVTPIEGFFISQKYHVYNSSDFSTLHFEDNNKLSSLEINLITSACCLAFFSFPVILIIIIIKCQAKKGKRTRD